MNANTGQSSGGHSAIRLGDLVFHFQYYPDKIFHIVREPWEEFRFVYGIQENRTIQIQKVNISEESYYFLLERMNEIYLIQRKELDNLVKLENDLIILQSIVHGDKSIHLKAMGYFQKSKSADKSYKSLSQKIHSRLGRNYILKNLNLARQKLYEFEFSIADSLDLNSDKKIYPTSVKNFSTEYLEIISQLKALEVLYDELGLNQNSYFEYKLEQNAFLFDASRIKYIQFIENLEEEIISLLESKTNNKGYPLLVTIARYLVLQKSLENNSHYFLDSYGKNHTLFIGSLIENRTFLSRIEKQLSTKVNSLAKGFFLKDEILSNDYTDMEDAVNRHLEIINGIVKSEPIRLNYEKMLPSKEENVFLNYINENDSSLRKLLEKVQANKNEYELALQKKYSFSLFSRNCTTEIFRSINAFFEQGNSESIRRLGGVIKEDEFLVFVPVYAYYAVGEKYNVLQVKSISSLRSIILQKDPSIQNSILESNTITSRYYKFNDEDSWFLFFTDNVFWQRPVYGILNFTLGIGETVVGFGKIPFDDGKQFVKGLQGIFFSAPELVFFNVRKGTFLHETNIEWKDNLVE